ncbi:MAG: NAD(+) synthase [Clostridia bacterium]
MKDGFLKVATATTDIKVANCPYNTERILQKIDEAHKNGAKLIVFPELCITGYTCGDLFLHKTLLKSAEESVVKIAKHTAKLEILIAVGVPVMLQNSLYNCACIMYKGEIFGLVPKTNIPNYSEFYEARYFTKGEKNQGFISYAGQDVRFGSGLLLQHEYMPEFKVGFEICEDVWVTNPPSCDLALKGATIIGNLSASDEIAMKSSYRRNLIAMQSGRTVSAYLYASAGEGESSTDMVYAGHNIIAENGTILSETKLFSTGINYADIDLEKLVHERRRMSSFDTCRIEDDTVIYSFDMDLSDTKIDRKFAQTPFVPQNRDELTERCEEILSLQAHGLATRLKHTHAKTAVIGLSGGLDSALALVVTAKAFDILGRDRADIICVTMPCFGTTSRTKNNAIKLSEAYSTQLLDINIRDSVNQHFSDIGHDGETLDVTFENAQARMRTQILMNLANKNGGLVIGTGDLSELALGWATYNGDHMSMYAVNASVPKTLVRYLIGYEAQKNEKLREVLEDVLDTPVSPELLPPKDGEISQKTEELVGPYELHDFFLYYLLRFGYSPRKIYRIAKLSFDGVYDDETIKKWLVIFIRRFFSQQFKRSCIPDGPKVGSVTLSPRGDLRMPSDACSDIWLTEAESL